MNTEETIQWLSGFGEIAIFGHKDKTWTANLNLFIPVDGVEFKIKAGFDNKTIGEAISTLKSKFETVMNSMQDKDKRLLNND